MAPRSPSIWRSSEEPTAGLNMARLAVQNRIDGQCSMYVSFAASFFRYSLSLASGMHSRSPGQCLAAWNAKSSPRGTTISLFNVYNLPRCEVPECINAHPCSCSRFRETVAGSWPRKSAMSEMHLEPSIRRSIIAKFIRFAKALKKRK